LAPTRPGRPKVVAAALLGAAAAAFSAGCGTGPGTASKRVGGHAAAPSFSRTAVNPGLGLVSPAAGRGHAVLLSFLDVTAAPAPGQPSRGQLVIVKSMDTQSEKYGLRTIIVDAGRARPSALVNSVYDWSLPRSIALVADGDGSLARAYGVNRAPTTFLIDSHGRIARRFDGLVGSAQLDFAIRRATGRGPVG